MKTNHIFKIGFFFTNLVVFQLTTAQILYTNGPLSTGTISKSGVTAPAGYTWSELQNDTGNNLVSNGNPGFPAYSDNLNNSFILKDNFFVPAGQRWTVTGVDLFYYQPNYTGTIPPINNLSMYLYTNPNCDSSSVCGQLISSTQQTSVLGTDAMMYRIFNTVVPAPGVTQSLNRKIWKIRVNINAVLAAGSYAINFTTIATDGGGVFFPSVTVPGVRSIFGWNAAINDGSTFNFDRISDNGSPVTIPPVDQDLPFNIIGTSVPALINDSCYSATPITNYPITFIENNGNQSTNLGGFNTICGVDGMNDGEWYTFQGNGGNVTLSLTGVQSGYDPQMSVYSGHCGNFSCVASTDLGGVAGDETLTIPVTQIYTNYFVNIGHFSGAADLPEGNFTLTVSNSKLVNDKCVDAVPITSFPYTYSRPNGVLATNNSEFITACFNGMNDGEWYKFTGNGNDVTIALTGVEANYDPQLGVFKNCFPNECVATTDIGYAGENENLTIPNTVLGTEYYINIGHFSDAGDNPEGNFTITVTTTNLATAIYEKASFKAYPNPVHDILTLESENAITKVAIYNLLGQEVLSESNNNLSKIDVSSLTIGTYIVKIVSNEEEKTIKIIKN
jgi:hypothetical protein